MKIAAKYLLITLLMPVYSIGIIGVGIYNCHCSHSSQFVLLANNNKCNCQHEDKCCREYVQEQTSEEHCCDRTYQVLQLDQVVNSNTFTFKNYSIDKALFSSVILIKTATPCLIAFHNYDPPPLKNSLSSDIYCLAQLRL
ncbi:MAG: hypothetical protein LBH91_02615 [Prevotellaceae bacterium]|jgi:hypothetical protein|nr:hypothetical protein [Prevotellaceae bacterium]